jgi:hypothetical protein
MPSFRCTTIGRKKELTVLFKIQYTVATIDVIMVMDNEYNYTYFQY